jgi:hypothetical protein
MHGLIDLSWDNPDYKDHKVTDAMLNQLWNFVLIAISYHILLN